MWLVCASVAHVAVVWASSSNCGCVAAERRSRAARARARRPFGCMPSGMVVELEWSCDATVGGCVARELGGTDSGATAYVCDAWPQGVMDGSWATVCATVAGAVGGACGQGTVGRAAGSQVRVSGKGSAAAAAGVSAGTAYVAVANSDSASEAKSDSMSDTDSDVRKSSSKATGRLVRAQNVRLQI